MSTWPSPRVERLGTPKTPAIRFSRALNFEASVVRTLLRPARLLAPLNGSDWITQPSGAFTSRLPAGRSPFPLLDMTTTVTGLLCWAGLAPAGMAASFAAREPHQGMPDRHVRRPHARRDNAHQPAAALVRVDGLRADVRVAAHRARRHPARASDLRHDPPEASQDRRPSDRLGAACEARARLRLSQSRRLLQRRPSSAKCHAATPPSGMRQPEPHTPPTRQQQSNRTRSTRAATTGNGHGRPLRGTLKNLLAQPFRDDPA
jgi:hypothetical protein